MTSNPMRERMLTKHFPHHVWITDDPLRDARLFNWTIENKIDFYDYYDSDRRQRLYGFKEAKVAVMVKLMFGGDV